MFAFVAARVRQTAIVALIVTTLAFVLLQLAPGDPFALTPDDAPEMAAARAELRARYGLDRPPYAQFPVMLANLARGEFGTSFSQARPVRDVMATVFPRTIVLMLPALALGIVGGALLGTWQGARAGRISDRLTGSATLAVLSVPEFLLGVIAATVFAVRLRWFPATGMMEAAGSGGAWATVADVARHAVLPVSTLAVVIACLVARYQRAAVAEALGEDFVRAARARGAPPRRVLLHHVLRRTAGTLLTVVGLLFPTLVGGAALIEMVFNWPGAGSTLLRAVLARDYPLVVGLVLVGSVAVSVGSALADVGAARANPATRLEA